MCLVWGKVSRNASKASAKKRATHLREMKNGSSLIGGCIMMKEKPEKSAKFGLDLF